MIAIASQSKFLKRRPEREASNWYLIGLNHFRQTKRNGNNIYLVLPYSRKLDACLKESIMLSKPMITKLSDIIREAMQGAKFPSVIQRIIRTRVEQSMQVMNDSDY
jgi:hypothetical protein